MTEVEIANVVRIVKESVLVPVQYRDVIVGRLRSNLAPESGGREAPLVTCGMYRHGAGDGLVHVLQADCHNPKPAPSSPSSAQGEGPVYCARCHLTEPLHHSPNIYTGRKDTRGHPYPPACEAFVAPTDPSRAGGGA